MKTLTGTRTQLLPSALVSAGMGRRATRRVLALATWGLVCVASLLPATGAAAEGEEAPGVSLYALAPSAHPSGVAIDPHGTVWFTASELARSRTVIGYLGAGEERTEFVISEGSGATGAASPLSGPDGNIWFVEGAADMIGRINPAGEVTEFPLPQGSQPGALTVGPDGNLWFTQRVGRIGRITPGGEISHFHFGPRSRPAGITAGPDGNVWFTLPGADKIGRISMSGEVALFRLPPTTRPHAIVTGPDGNLWFTEGSWTRRGRKGRNKIGRITPGGAVRQFRVQAPMGTGSIVAGPREIFFTTGTRVRDSQIGSISPAGAVTRYACLSDSCQLPAYGLAIDAEGAIWFAAGFPSCSLCGGGAVINMNLTLPGQIGRLAP